MVAQFLDLIRQRAPVAAAALAVAQLQHGYRPDQVISDLLVPVQVEVGRRWHRALWTAADEHQATAVTDAALYGVTSDGIRPREIRGTAAVACAVGDWHVLPSRMAAELLRLDGWDVLFLGGSLPPADLSQWLIDARPDVLVVSCSMPTTARSVVATAMAGAEVGVPVVVGGRGMGLDGRRAAALGVRWAADLKCLAAALAAPTPATAQRELAERLEEHSELLLRRTEIVAGAVNELGRLWPAMSAFSDTQMSRTSEDFGHIVDFLGAAVATDDPRLFGEFVDWLRLLLSSRHLPPAVLQISLRALAAALPRELPLAPAILATTRDSLPMEVR